MIINNEIRIKYKIKRKPKLYFISDDVRENIKDYSKKEND